MLNDMRLASPILLVLSCCPVALAESDSRIARVEALRQALDQEHFDDAATLLTGDPRVWYGSREGEGYPWKLRAGRWKTWDSHFNGVSEQQGPLQTEGDRVWADFFETNDYFRLIGRRGGYFRQTWFFASNGKIEGYMISAVPGAPESPAGRGDEFTAWARENAAEELEYLRPEGKIDPTGDRAARTGALLERWRQAIGEPLDDDGS